MFKMSLFVGDFASMSQGFASRHSGSGSSLDELDVSGGVTPTASAERFERQVRHLQKDCLPKEDEEEWDIISKKIDSCVRLDTEFFEYPTQETFSSPPSSGNIDDDELTGTKVFLGGMRFEVVQMGRHMVSWLLEVACGVKLPFGRILIHRKSRNGKPAAPTGCASVYVADDDDVKRLIAMNQRVFCGERGLHVASTPARMAELIQSRTILDIADGRVRGPTHPMIIEKAYSTATHSPVSLTSTPQNNSFTASLTGSFAGQRQAPETTSLLPDGCAPPVYHRYEGDTKAAVLTESSSLAQPLELFVGGLCYEATRSFVAWIFSLIGVKLHPQNVTLYVDPQTGVKRGCAQVRIEEADFAVASSYTRRMLCDACGVYISDTPQGIVAVQQTKERSEHGTRGPTHAVVIERRRNNMQRTTPQHLSTGSPSNTVLAPPNTQAHAMVGQLPAPPPPPAMQLVQMPGGQYVMVVNAQPGFPQMASPPPGWSPHQQSLPSQSFTVSSGGQQPYTLLQGIVPMATPPGGHHLAQQHAGMMGQYPAPSYRGR